MGVFAYPLYPPSRLGRSGIRGGNMSNRLATAQIRTRPSVGSLRGARLLTIDVPLQRAFPSEPSPPLAPVHPLGRPPAPQHFPCRGTTLMVNRPTLGTYRRAMPRVLGGPWEVSVFLMSDVLPQSASLSEPSPPLAPVHPLERPPTPLQGYLAHKKPPNPGILP